MAALIVVSEANAANGPRGSLEPELPPQRLRRDSLSACKLLASLRKAAIGVVRINFLVCRREQQDALDGIRRRRQADEQTARSRQIFLGKGVHETMKSGARAHGRDLLRHLPEGVG